jgi:copper chaperone CopZ
MMLALAGAALPALAETTIKATVNGMVCAFCAQGIEKRLSGLPAAKEVFVDLKQRVVAVELKPGQTLDEKTMTQEINDAGYSVVKLETLQQPLAAVKGAGKP